ncbi:MAG: hypothetical protein AAF639_27515 [Chloroflexota bacterium]
MNYALEGIKGMKPFSKWTIIEVEKEFQVKLQRKSNLLDDWISPTDDCIQELTAPLKSLQSRLIEDVYDWNEAELKIKFIGPLLDLIDFDSTTYKSFFERHLSVPYKDKKLSGDVDLIVAAGRRAPEQPYFFLHEHKKDSDSSGDPLGQLMITMLAAQLLNQIDHPIYGSYVIGRLWYFVVLDRNEYAVSLAYDATLDRLSDIFRILKKTRAIIDELSSLHHTVESA